MGRMAAASSDGGPHWYEGPTDEEMVILSLNSEGGPLPIRG